MRPGSFVSPPTILKLNFVGLSRETSASIVPHVSAVLLPVVSSASQPIVQAASPVFKSLRAICHTILNSGTLIWKSCFRFRGLAECFLADLQSLLPFQHPLPILPLDE